VGSTIRNLLERTIYDEPYKAPQHALNTTVWWLFNTVIACIRACCESFPHCGGSSKAYMSLRLNGLSRCEQGKFSGIIFEYCVWSTEKWVSCSNNEVDQTRASSHYANKNDGCGVIDKSFLVCDLRFSHHYIFGFYLFFLLNSRCPMQSFVNMSSDSSIELEHNCFDDNSTKCWHCKLPISQHLWAIGPDGIGSLHSPTAAVDQRKLPWDQEAIMCVFLYVFQTQ